MKRFAIFGAGGCGRGVLPLVRQQLRQELAASLCELVFVDDRPSSAVINEVPVLTYAQWLSQPAISRHICVAIANSYIRSQVVQRCVADGVQFFSVNADNVVQLDDIQLGEGAILCPFVTLTSNIRIGRHFHANIYSYVEHDCVVGDFVTFAPGVMCNGNVHVGDHVFIGAGAVIRQGLTGEPLVIGRGAVVGMGAVVIDSVPPGATVVGNPARPLVKN